ncbi:hypothetical protein [Arthrobacter castelli]|uniref:hypothetical protein n=1 Tax=Arthrobacter castelli TaxID=271431 RepID=UPI0003F611F9|nr:hypothetical protein [Arthrobacter castelli]
MREDSKQLQLADEQVTADLRTFVSLARAIDDGGVRLQASGTVLAAYVCVMQPKGLGESTPTILGLRTMNLAAPAELDTTVPLSAVSDRLARMRDAETALQIPPMTVSHSWSGISPDRSGWSRQGTLSGEHLMDTAKAGVREVAEIVPANPGTLIVNNARNAVWGRPIEGTQVPAGAAFAAYGLGFLTPEGQVAVYGHHRWMRLSSERGHVLIRPAVSL